MQGLAEDGWKVYLILLWIRIEFLFQWYILSIHNLFMPTVFRLANPKQMLRECIDLLHKPKAHQSHIPQYTSL